MTFLMMLVFQPNLFMVCYMIVYLKNENRYDDFIDYTKNRIARKLRYNENERRILSKPHKKDKVVGYDR